MTRSIVHGPGIVIDMGDNKLTNLADGVAADDAATVGQIAGGSVTYGTPAIVLGTTAAAGSVAESIKRDATIVAFDATVPTTQAFGDTAAAGSAAVAARRDHKHAMPATPTSVSGNAGTATALATARNIDGQAFDGTADITVIAPGTHAATGKTTPADADELPLVDSAASNVLKKLTWANLKATLKTYFDTLYPSGSGTSTGTNTGDVAFATNAVVLGSAAAAGAASTVMRSNDTIAAFDATSPSTQAVGDSAVVGVAAFAARRDHKHAMPSFATPAIVLGSAAAAGSAVTLVRSDGTIAAFDTTVPTTQAFADAAAIGTAAFAARRDHKHAMPANPVGIAWTYVFKTLDEGVTGSTTFQADDELFFTATNGGIYEFFAVITYLSALSAATPDIKSAFGEDTTVRGTYINVGLSAADSGTQTVQGTLTNAGVSRGTAATARSHQTWGTHWGAGGTFGHYFAQNTSDGNPTTVKGGNLSYLAYRRMA